MRTTALTTAFGVMILATFAIGAKERYYYSPFAPTTMPRVAEGTPDPAVKKLVDDLGSDDWRTREKAGRELGAMGEKALPHMRKILLNTEDPEVQRRLSILVRKLDRERLVAPKTVTYEAKDQSAKDIVAEIAKQTGYKIEFTGDSQTKHSFEFNNTPFWQAIDKVANAAGCNAVAEYEDNSIRIYQQATTNPYVAYSGPFRFTATGINSSRNVQLAGINRGSSPPMSEYINMSFQIQSEPKNPMMGITIPDLTEAKDNLGGSLLPPRERTSYSPGYINRGYRGYNSHMSVNLIRADRSATSIKSLKGRVGIVLLAGSVTEVTVPDALKTKKKTFIGRSIEMEFDGIDEDANQKGVYSVSFTVKRRGQTDPNRNDDYYWSESIWQRLELTDEKGGKYFCYGPTTHNIPGAGTVQLVVQFGPDDRRTGRPNPVKLGPPTKFALNEWLTITHEVNFEFKDIPLP